MPDYFLRLSDQSVELPAPIKQKMEIGALIVVRVYPSDDMLNGYPQEKLNRNIYAYDSSSGELAWQIQEAPHGGAGEDKAYMSIKLVGDKLIAGNWIGTDYFVALDSGRVSKANKDIRPW